MVKRYKIFEVTYQSETTFEGYFDGYGRESINNPVLKEVRGYLARNFETKEEAEDAITTHGNIRADYIISVIFSKQ